MQPTMTIGIPLQVMMVGSAFYVIIWTLNLSFPQGQLVDTVIMPVAPHAAVIPGKYYHTGRIRLSMRVQAGHDIESDTTVNIAYTEAINLMDFSVAVIPVTKADKSIDLFDHDYEPLNDDDRKNWEACECPRKFSLRTFYFASANA